MRATCMWTLGLAVCLGTLGSWSTPAAEAQTKARAGNLTQFIAPDFCVAIVIHPKQILDSPVGAMLPPGGMSSMMAGQAGTAEAGKLASQVDPKLLRRVVLLADPASLETKRPPAMIFQFEEDFDGEAFFKQAYDDAEQGTIEAMAVLTSKKAGQDDIAGVVYVAGPRILVMGLEPTVQKMLAPTDAPRPLLDQLKRCNLKNDIIVEVLAEPLAKTLAQPANGGTPGLPPQAMMAAGLLQEVKSASLQVNFSGNQLLQLALVGAKPDSVEKLHAQLSFIQMMAAQQSLAPKPKEKTPDASNPLGRIGEELLKGLSVKKEKGRVLLAIKMPDDLPGLLQESVMAAMQMAAPTLEESMPKETPAENAPAP